MMECNGGASIVDVRVRNGQRQSAFRSYVVPFLDRPNLTVLPHALVTRLTVADNRVAGVEFHHDDTVHCVGAGCEVVLSLGAIHTPKLLMQSGIGDAEELRRFGIPVIQHLPGVGRNFQDHALIPINWEYRESIAPPCPESYATFFWTTDDALDTPDVQACILPIPWATPEVAEWFAIPEYGWTMCAGVVRPEPRPRPPHRTEPARSRGYRGQHARRRPRHEGGGRLRRLVPGDRPFGAAATLRQVRVSPGHSSRQRARGRHPQHGSNVLASGGHREDGPGRAGDRRARR